MARASAAARARHERRRDAMAMAIGGGAPPGVGGGALLDDEANGFATDFTHAVDTERVALKTAGATTYSTVDGFYANAGTSPKMVYDVSGVLGWSPHNLVRESKDASVNLSVSGATVTTNVTAGPLGDVTADQIALDGGNDDYFYKDQTGFALVGVTYCGAVWLKAAAPVQIGIRVNNGDGSGSTVAVVNVTTAWQQFYVSCVSGSTSPINFGLDTRSFVSGDDGLAKTVIAADWQINYGTVPTAYLPTTSAARVGLALDYDPVTHAARGLLCEPQATNLVKRSSELDDPVLWTPTNVTVVANQAVAPDGTMTMDKIYPTTSGGNRWITPAVTGSAVTHTYSVFAKAAGLRWLYFLGFDGLAFVAWFDLQNGVVGNVIAGYTSAIQAVGNGVYRCSVTGMGQVAFNAFLGMSDANGGSTVTASGTNGIYLWGAQLETGTVATSPIPTLGATVTRAADVVKVTPASINYSATAGSWWVDASFNAVIGSSRIICNISGSNTPLFMNNATQFGLYDGVAFLTKTVGSTLGSHKLAAAFASADRAMTVDGLAVATDTTAGSSLLSPGASIGFGCDPNTVDQINGYIRKLRYLPRRKTNAELVTETTP